MEMRLIFILLMLILCSSIVYAGVIINEIMYNPYGSDEGREWIEIYTNETVNLSGWKFYEDETAHGLVLINGSWVIEDYAVIVDDWRLFLVDYPDYGGILIDSSWGSLSQSGESLALKNNSGGIVDEVNYSAEWGGNEVSLERIDPSVDSNEKTNWGNSLIAKGTPGKQNSLFGSCDWSISIIIDDSIWEIEDDKAVVKWKVKVEEDSDDGDVGFSYWIEDPTGEIIKSKINKDTNVSETFGYYQKTFHNPGGYIIFAEITNTSCYDFNSKNNFIKTALIVIGGNQSGSAYKSLIKILDVPSSVAFGDVVNAKINVYRGDTRKYAVYAWIEDGEKISEKTTMHFKTKFTNYTLTIPIQLKPNCNERYKDGKYNLVLEGLDEKDSEKIKIEGLTSSLCKEVKSECEKCPKEEIVEEFEEAEAGYLEYEDFEEFTENVISEEQITGSMVYESKEIKAKRSGIFFFCFILILLIAYFIFVKKGEKI